MFNFYSKKNRRIITIVIVVILVLAMLLPMIAAYIALLLVGYTVGTLIF